MKINQQANDLLSTFINQLWRLVSGPITMLLIPLFLSPEQQGYWYLFGSISALTIFADLGFSNIILQFSAHEFANLGISESNVLIGDEYHLKKLGSFLRFTLKWISTISLIVFPVIFIVGVFFFVRDGVLAVYIIPWVIFSLGSLVSFAAGSILSFIEGLNKIAIVQKIRFRVSVINTLFVSLILLLHGNIYALAIGSLFSSLSIFISLFGSFRGMLWQLLTAARGFSYGWRKEIFPLFTKYALSFSSGYFIFSIYTPLMHYFHGPVYSGKIGITMALAMAIFSMSNIWMYTITPKINMLVSKKQWKEMDALFSKRLWLSLGTYLFIIFGLFLFLKLFGSFWIIPKIVARFLPLDTFLMLLGCYLCQLVVNSWAIYLRGHKEEPYVIPSIITAIWIALTTFFVGKYATPEWFFIGFLSSYVWGIPLCGLIYKKCKDLWHVKI